jgi:hypothetical protein
VIRAEIQSLTAVPYIVWNTVQLVHGKHYVRHGDLAHYIRQTAEIEKAAVTQRRWISSPNTSAPRQRPFRTRAATKIDEPTTWEKRKLFNILLTIGGKSAYRWKRLSGPPKPPLSLNRLQYAEYKHTHQTYRSMWGGCSMDSTSDLVQQREP